MAIYIAKRINQLIILFMLFKSSIPFVLHYKSSVYCILILYSVYNTVTL